jgi:cephalosporin-C deacetylase
MLMFTGLMDVICPPSTQFAIYNNVTSEKSHVIFPDYGHEGIPYMAQKKFEFMTELL